MFHTYEICILLNTGHYLTMIFAETSPETAKVTMERVLAGIGIRSEQNNGRSGVYDDDETTIKEVTIDLVLAVA